MVRYLMCKDFMMAVVDSVFRVGRHRHIQLYSMQTYKNWNLAPDAVRSSHTHKLTHIVPSSSMRGPKAQPNRSARGRASGRESHSHLTNPLFVINIHNNFLPAIGRRSYCFCSINVFMLDCKHCFLVCWLLVLRRNHSVSFARGLSAWYG